ncbi:MAG: GNAT family N-acetyltransferase [Bacilli bacterium]
MKIKQRNYIITKRLILKSLSFEDKKDLSNILIDEEVSSTFMLPDFKNLDSVNNLSNKLIEYSQVENEEHLFYGIFLNSLLIGFVNECGFDNEIIEIGYVISPTFKNNGYATEAVSAILNDLKRMGFKKVIAGFFSENIASRKVMENCGMTKIDKVVEIVYKSKVYECLYYEMDFLQDEYLKKLNCYYDEQGLLILYPKKKPLRLLVLQKIVDCFENEKKYTEKEVNTIIKSNIAFSDIELIRRELIDYQFMQRTNDCRAYWKTIK